MLTGLCEVKRFAVSFYCLCLSFKHFLLPGPYITLLYALLSFKSLLSNLALSLPVISFFEGDDAKMLFFSLSLRPLWVCFYFMSRKFIFVMRFISEHVNTVSQSRGSPSCVWVLSGGCQACVLSVSILLSPAGWMHLKRLKLRSTRSRSQKSWTSFNLFFWDAAVKNQKVEICFSND